jgi:hypothetical protein
MITRDAFKRLFSFICEKCVIQVRACSTKSIYGAYYGEIVISQFGVRKHAESSSSSSLSESDEGEVDFGDSDKDIDLGEVTTMQTQNACMRKGYSMITTNVMIG